MDYFMTHIGWIVYDRCRRSGGRDSGFDTTRSRRVRCAYLLHSQDGANWLADVEGGGNAEGEQVEIGVYGDRDIDIHGSAFSLPPILSDLEEDPCSCLQGIHPLTFPSRSQPIPYEPSPPHPTHYSVQPPPIPTPSTSDPAYDFSGFATTMNTSATSVETIKSPLKDGDTGVTRTQKRG
ncbi:hypothetical protein M422DRAFT_242727 [Sphaerobolus stellatus SS14]|nr:hypothetical protein M422DRAFT_242727 [Sphaerobolus stellatus SS14]